MPASVFNTRCRYGAGKNKKKRESERERKSENERKHECARGHARVEKQREVKVKTAETVRRGVRASSKGPGTPQTRAITSHFRKLPARSFGRRASDYVKSTLHLFSPPTLYTYGAAGDKIQSNALSRTRDPCRRSHCHDLHFPPPRFHSIPLADRVYSPRRRVRNDSLCLSEPTESRFGFHINPANTVVL